MKRLFVSGSLAVIAAALMFPSTASGAEPQKHNEAGIRTEALDNSAWRHSQWISVADAPVIRGNIEGDNILSADTRDFFHKWMRDMNSFNHYAYGCVCEWLWKTMAGISADTSEPGFRRIIMKPVPDRRLGFVNAEYASAAGTIKSSWKYDKNRWNWSFTVPQGYVAEVTLPGETESKEYTAGSYNLSKIID